MKKDTLVRIFFISAVCVQLLFFHLPEEIRYPLFLLSVLLILILWSRDHPILFPKQFTILYSLGILVTVISALSNFNKFQATLEITKTVSLFFFTLLAINLFQKKKWFSIFFAVTLVSCFWAIAGILDYTFRSKGNFVPLFIPFYWPSLASSFYLLIFPYTLTIFLVQKIAKWQRLILFISLFLIVTAWFLSLSHLDILLLTTFGLTIIFIYSSVGKPLAVNLSGNSLKWLLLLILLLLVTLPNFFPSFGEGKLLDQVAIFQEKIFFFDRADVLRFSKESIRDHFWWGIGPGNFGSVYRLNQSRPWTWSDFASNEFLQTFVETGFMGLFIFILLFLYLMILCFKKILFYRKNYDLFSLSLSFSVFFFLFSNLNDFSWRIFPLLIVFFLLVSFLIAKEKVFKVNTKISFLLTSPFLLLSFIVLTDALLLRLGQNKFTTGKINQSEGIFRALVKRPIFLLNPKSFYWLTATQLDKGDREGATTLLNKTSILEPNNLEILYQIAKGKYAEGNKEEAKNLLVSILDKYPYSSPKYYLALGKIYIELKKEKEAISTLLKAEKVFPPENKRNLKGKEILEAIEYSPTLRQIYYLLYQLTGQKKYLIYYFE